ncbi:MAG: peptidoglycan-binding domain-containing protein [Nostocaceae cyanobacterium]|nr:peptidoglycan-binding domain-containing protein [Nostocaceae cyanobacterium]
MNSRFNRLGFVSLGFISAFVFTTLPFSLTPAKAQDNTLPSPSPGVGTGNIPVQGSPRTTQDGTTQDGSGLTQYSPGNAPLLNRGSRGQAVRDLQTFLQQQGVYNGQIDGIYGPQTAAAVASFQRSRNLTADGIAGRQTWQAVLNNTGGITSP